MATTLAQLEFFGEGGHLSRTFWTHQVVHDRTRLRHWLQYSQHCRGAKCTLERPRIEPPKRECIWFSLLLLLHDMAQTDKENIEVENPRGSIIAYTKTKLFEL